MGLFAAASPAATSSPVIYQANDTQPDLAGAPDLSNIAVSDSSQGTITFQFTFVPGTEDWTKDNLAVYIDSDQNPATGDPSWGTDYVVEYDGPSDEYAIYKWDGTQYTLFSDNEVSVDTMGDTLYFFIAPGALGITEGFNFFAEAGVGDDTASSTIYDLMPEGATLFHYTMQLFKPAVKLSLAGAEVSPLSAGNAFQMALAVKRSDTGSLLGAGAGAKIQCALTIGGKAIRASAKFFINAQWYSGGGKMAAVCFWKIPASAVGKPLVAREAVSLGSSTVSGPTFRHRVGK
jgi:hypothetical protein